MYFFVQQLLVYGNGCYLISYSFLKYTYNQSFTIYNQYPHHRIQTKIIKNKLKPNVSSSGIIYQRNVLK